MPFVALCLMACSEKEEIATVTDVSGKYEGYTIANCTYMQNLCSAGETVTVTANADGSANVTFTSDTWGEFAIPNAQMSESDGVYILSGNGQTEMGMGGNTSSYDCTFTATINSLSDAKMQFVVPGVMGGLTIDFETGEAPADLLLSDTYKGYSKADCAYFKDRYTDDESLKVSANGDGTISVIFESASWGTFTVETATITKEDNGYEFTGNGSVAMGMGESTNNYDFTMTGTSDSAKETYSFAFNIPAVMGGLTVTLLPGNAPAVTE